MRRTVLLTFALLALSATPALAYDDGIGAYGPTDDRVVTYAGFILIAFFPLLVFVLTMVQRRLDKRKDSRKRAAKARRARADLRGGW